MGRTPVKGLVLLATLSLLACDGQGTAPLGESRLTTQLVHGLELDLSLDPTTTAPGGSFTAAFTITNRRTRATTLTSGCNTLAWGVVYRTGDDEHQSFIGTTAGCYTVPSTYRLEAGASMELVWNVTAARRLYRGDFQWETVLPLEGEYTFRVSPHVITIDQESARLPELDVAFRVN